MPVCAVCGLTDFVEEDGLFYCSECHTRNEDARVEVFEEKFQDSILPSQWLVCSQAKAEPEDEIGNIKILTSWETFNICLKGLVNELTALGATPVFEAMVFKMWSLYLQKTEAAFFSTKKKPPRLPKHAWTSDAFLVYNIQKTSMSVEDVVGKKQKGRKRKIADVTAGSSKDDIEPAPKTPNLLGSVKRKFFNKMYEEVQSSCTLNDTMDVSSFTYKPESKVNPVPRQILTRTENADMVPLRRKHLLAFVYLGMLITHQEIHLSDLLRWIDEGHVHYHQLNKFFMPGVAVLDDLKEYFMEKKNTPKYADISRLTWCLAKFLRVRSIPPPDINGLVHKFCNEFNLPNQVALVSRRLIQLLPVRVQDPEFFNTITSWETRAMAQIIVTLKILLGFDDASEHRNSRIAAQIKELLSHGGSTIEPFIWDDWVQWSALRSIALVLHGKAHQDDSINTGMYQNIDTLVAVWKNYVSSTNIAATSAKRRKLETNLMAELIASLDWENSAYESHCSRYPATTTPYHLYTQAVLNQLENGLLPCSNEPWNALVRNLDVTQLRKDFRSTSIEYLLHPERYIEWAQQKGLSIGLRNGGAFKKTYKSPELYTPSETFLLKDTKWRVSLTKKTKKKEKKIQPSGAKSVILPAVTKPDNTRGRPLEPLEDLTDAVPLLSYRTEPLAPYPPQAMPLPEEEDRYLHIPSTEYYTHSRKAKDAPISFRYFIEMAVRYLHLSKNDLLEEIKVVEDIHQHFLNFCSDKITLDSPEVVALKK